MCHLSVEVDQSVHPVAAVVETIDASPFYIRSIRVVPVAWSRQASVYLSLGGGSDSDLSSLLGSLQRLPAVRSMQHSPMPV